MELCDLPRWLARDRENKVNSSVVLTFNARNQALNALKGVNIAGKHCDTEIFTSVRPNTECINCQKFGHNHYQCRNKSKCNICAQNHETRNHECITCKSKTACSHVVVKCANCNKNHQSNDEYCEIFTALIKSTKIGLRIIRLIMAGQHSLANIENTHNVKFIQHNCGRSTNAMISCLEYALSNQIDIVLFQEPWTRDQKTISHPSFTCIMPKIATYRSRVAIFVTKCNPKLQCTPRTDLIDDSDMQIIEIRIDEVRKVQIFNIYNEKSQNDRETYTIDRLLIKYQPTSTNQFIICGDFNAHHNWWNSKIKRAIRSENLVKWLKINKCSLINTPDFCTFYAHSGSSSSVIDLRFANSKIENAITNWAIDENVVTGSDHEVIRFELIASFKNLTSHAFLFYFIYSLSVFYLRL